MPYDSLWSRRTVEFGTLLRTGKKEKGSLADESVFQKNLAIVADRIRIEGAFWKGAIKRTIVVH